MSSQDNPSKLSKLNELIKNLPDFIKEFKGSIIAIIAWLVVAELAGYSLIRTLWSIIKLIIYPLNLLLFNLSFKTINVPEIFILLIPLIILISVGLLIIISTED